MRAWKLCSLYILCVVLDSTAFASDAKGIIVPVEEVEAEFGTFDAETGEGILAAYRVEDGEGNVLAEDQTDPVLLTLLLLAAPFQDTPIEISFTADGYVPATFTGLLTSTDVRFNGAIAEPESYRFPLVKSGGILPKMVFGSIHAQGTNAPVPEAEVRLLELNLTAYTDNMGFYIFPVVVVDQVTIEVRAQGYARRTVQAAASPADSGITTDILLSLPIASQPVPPCGREKFAAGEGLLLALACFLLYGGNGRYN